MIGHPKSTWGVLDGNPTQGRIRHDGALLPVDFCINVTVNRDRAITGFFCGDVLAAHEAGCAFSRETAMVACDRPFPVVVTTNSGYPLDQNLYQAVKGMSAAAQIVIDGGSLSRRRGATMGFRRTATSGRCCSTTPRLVRCSIRSPRPAHLVFDQWEAQLLALIRLKARVGPAQRNSGRRGAARRTWSRWKTLRGLWPPSCDGSGRMRLWRCCRKGR